MMNTTLLRQAEASAGAPPVTQLQFPMIESKVRESINKIKTGYMYMEANMPEQAMAQLLGAIAYASVEELGPGWGLMLLTAAINEGALPADITELEDGLDAALERMEEAGMALPDVAIETMENILDMYAKFY